MLFHRLGRLADAEAEAHAVLGAEDVENPLFRAFTLGVIVEVLVDRGRSAEAAAALAAAGAADSAPETMLHALAHARGRARMARGQAAEALADFLGCGRTLVATGSVNPAAIPWRSSAALAHAALGEDAEAVRLAREELEIATRFGAPRALGVALRVVGSIERDERCLAEAVQVLESSGAQLELAEALTHWGATLRRERQPRRAREPLRRAVELASRCGAEPLATRARDELIAAGARPRRVALSGVESLTPMERRVAQLAKEGLANREIAQTLFLTVRTVETHLRHAYQKLGVASRTELPDELTPQ